MTVLYFADTRFPIERANGTQTMATCHALAGRGHDVTLVVRPDTAATPRDPFAFYGLPADSRLHIKCVGTTGPSQARRVHFLLAAAAMAARTSGVVYTRDLGVAAFLLQAPLLRRPRVVYESHGVADVVAAELPRLLGPGIPTPSAAKLARLARREARVWKRAAGYVTITRALADELGARFGARAQVDVVPDGARLPAEATTFHRAVHEPLTIGYAGHLYPWKGVDVLVRAISAAPGVRGLIVGGHPAEGDRRRLEELAHALGVADRLTFVGLVPPSRVAAELAPASVLCLPNTLSAVSERYTSPLKLFEYLTMGRPIVASNLPAIREVLTDGSTALLVAPGDPAALAAAFVRLAGDAALITRLGETARALADEYTWERRAARLETVIEAAAA